MQWYLWLITSPGCSHVTWTMLQLKTKPRFGYLTQMFGVSRSACRRPITITCSGHLSPLVVIRMNRQASRLIVFPSFSRMSVPTYQSTVNWIHPYVLSSSGQIPTCISVPYLDRGNRTFGSQYRSTYSMDQSITHPLVGKVGCSCIIMSLLNCFSPFATSFPPPPHPPQGCFLCACVSHYGVNIPPSFTNSDKSIGFKPDFKVGLSYWPN